MRDSEYATIGNADPTMRLPGPVSPGNGGNTFHFQGFMANAEVATVQFLLLLENSQSRIGIKTDPGFYPNHNGHDESNEASSAHHEHIRLSSRPA
jgi:hypothetical protein